MGDLGRRGARRAPLRARFTGRLVVAAGDAARIAWRRRRLSAIVAARPHTPGCPSAEGVGGLVPGMRWAMALGRPGAGVGRFGWEGEPDEVLAATVGTGDSRRGLVRSLDRGDVIRWGRT